MIGLQEKKHYVNPYFLFENQINKSAQFQHLLGV